MGNDVRFMSEKPDLAYWRVPDGDFNLLRSTGPRRKVQATVKDAPKRSENISIDENPPGRIFQGLGTASRFKAERKLC